MVETEAPKLLSGRSIRYKHSQANHEIRTLLVFDFNLLVIFEVSFEAFIVLYSLLPDKHPCLLIALASKALRNTPLSDTYPLTPFFLFEHSSSRISGACAMTSSPPAASPSTKAITPQEALTLQTERLWRLGEIGLSTRFPDPEDIIASHRVPRVEDEESEILATEADWPITTAMSKTHNALRQLQKDDKVLRDNKQAVATLESDVDAILLAGGKSKRFVAAQDLRAKLRHAIEMKSPHQASDTVTVLIVDPSVEPDPQMKSGFKQVNLPLGASLDEVYKLLRSVMKAESLLRCNETGESPQVWDDPGIVWKYQLMANDNSKLLQAASIKLEIDSDWKRLCLCIAGRGTQGSKPPKAVLTCVSLLQWIKGPGLICFRMV